MKKFVLLLEEYSIKDNQFVKVQLTITITNLQVRYIYSVKKVMDHDIQ